MDLIDETDEINGPFTAIFLIPYAPSNDPVLQRPSAAIVLPKNATSYRSRPEIEISRYQITPIGP